MRPLLTLLTALTLTFTPALHAQDTPTPDAKPAADTPKPAAKKRTGPGAGDIPPAGLGRTRDGDEIDTSQYAGKVLIVTFWASWCPPCRAELPVLEGVKKAGKGQIEVVAINIEDRDTFRKLARHLSSLSVTLTHDNGKRQHDAYGVNGIPHMVIIGKDGKIINVHRGYSESALDGLVAEINAALAKG